MTTFYSSTWLEAALRQEPKRNCKYQNHSALVDWWFNDRTMIWWCIWWSTWTNNIVVSHCSLRCGHFVLGDISKEHKHQKTIKEGVLFVSEFYLWPPTEDWELKDCWLLDDDPPPCPWDAACPFWLCWTWFSNSRIKDQGLGTKDHDDPPSCPSDALRLFWFCTWFWLPLWPWKAGLSNVFMKYFPPWLPFWPKMSVTIKCLWNAFAILPFLIMAPMLNHSIGQLSRWISTTGWSFATAIFLYLSVGH